MKIAHIKIKNFLGVKEVDLKPKKTTIIEGKNTSGKTSILKAIQATFEGVSPDLRPIRIGAQKAELFIDLEEFKIKRTMTEKGHYLSIETASGDKKKAPQEFLKSLIGHLPFNPVEFIFLEPKEQKRYLLNIIQTKITREQFGKMIKDFLEKAQLDIFESDFDRPALDVISDARVYYYNIRRTVNQEVDKKGKVFEDISKQIIGFDPKSYDKDLKEQFQAKVTETEKELSKAEILREQYKNQSDQIQTLESFIANSKAEINEINSKVQELSADIPDLKVIEDKIKDLKEQITKLNSELAIAEDEFVKGKEKIQKVGNLMNEKVLIASNLKKNESMLENLKKTLPDISEAKLETLTTELGKLKRSIAEIDQYEDKFKAWERSNAMDEELKELIKKSSTLDELIIKLTKEIPDRILKEANLNLGGLAFDGDDILIDGKALGSLSGKEQLMVSLEVAKKLTGTLKLICIDGIERLDDSNFKEFVKVAENDEFQYFITSVVEHEGAMIMEGGELKGGDETVKGKVPF